jgi:hypothetical protein
VGDFGDVIKETVKLLSNVIKVLGDYSYVFEIYKNIEAMGGYFDAMGQDCF